MWDNGRSTPSINISNLLTGQRDKFLTDSASDNKEVYWIIPKPSPFLSPKSHKGLTTACSNGWITITNYCWNDLQRIGHVTVQKNFRIINDIRAECYIYGNPGVSTLKFCSALPWHGYSCFFWPCWHLPSVWGRGVSKTRLLIQISVQVRFKLIVRVSYSDFTFIYIKTVSTEGSIFHFPNKLC
jgi:hypothetical protein